MYLSQCRLLMVVTAATLLCAREARPAAILYYTGDSNGQAAYGNYQDLSGKVNIPESQVFENFIVAPGAPWNVTSLFVNETDLGPSNVTEATWSIRTGMGPGNPGTVLYSGTSAATEGAGAISQITVAGLNIDLPPGDYWMNITPQTNGTKLLANTTSGANEINATLTQSGLWYEPQAENYTPVDADFSIGIDGVLIATPEPASWVLMATLFAGLAVFSKKRAAALKPCAIAARAARSNRGLQK
jgi:hypothetical protein